MLIKIFAVHDSAAKAYLPPFFMLQEGQATRTFQDCVNSEDHKFYHHPADYTLFHLGNFDDENATFEPLSIPTSLGNGVEYASHTNQPGKENETKVSNDPQLFRNAQGGDPSI